MEKIGIRKGRRPLRRPIFARLYSCYLVYSMATFFVSTKSDKAYIMITQGNYIQLNLPPYPINW
jgi:hypothetical protein